MKMKPNRTPTFSVRCRTFDLLVAQLLLLSVATAGFGQPIITNQPRILAVALGTTATFTVGAGGTAPLAYQWQRNLSDLPGRTSATLTLPDVQLSDQADYRVVVSDAGGSVTSAVAHLYVMSFAKVAARSVLDNFDDNLRTGWTSGSEADQQFTVSGYWPGQQTTSTYDTASLAVLSTSYWTLGQGQTLEWRVELIRLDDNAPNAARLLLGRTSGLYAFLKGRDFIALNKYDMGTVSPYSFERASTPNANVVLAFALTRVDPNVLLTARVLDKDNPDRVLYQHSVVDTPNSDPTLTTADVEALSGMRLAFGPEASSAPYTYVASGLGLFQYTDGNQPAATVTYDNFELWTYRLPLAHYVDANSTNATSPYTSWATAARVIQDAVDAAAPGDEIVVTNGTYATGGRVVGTNVLVNRVAVDKPLTVRSVNGPQFTVIRGYQVPGTTNGDTAIRCVYLTNGASLSGFTLTNGATRTVVDWLTYEESSGGGVYCESDSAVVTNCLLTANSAWWSGGGAYGGTLNDCTLTRNWSTSLGGGACASTLNHCTLTGNSCQGGGFGSDGGAAALSTLNNCTLANNSTGGGGGGAYDCTLNNCTVTANMAGHGGGAVFGTLNNCTVTGNSAEYGSGGANGGTLNNCIVYFNTAPSGSNYYQDGNGGVFNFCCTTPQPTNGVGNITNAPLFVDYAGANLRLQSNSPCINAGLNAYAPGLTDLDGRPRIVGGAVDMGAYEFQGPGMGEFVAWLQRYGLPTDGSADFADPDRDGLNTWQEWRCQTDPTNALSVLRLLSASSDGTNVTVTWQSVEGVSYFLERSTDLSATPPFSLLATNLLGLPGMTTFTDTKAAAARLLFYRVGVP